jgi:2-polyprenyl-3-methyl-5-hydroxy-6-metoxy-1,4-benzoquinol methylase
MKCRVCFSEKLSKILDLGEQPWCNDFLKKKQLGYEKFYPLLLLYCNTCNTVQLNYTVKKEIMFSNHTYLSGITKTLSDHFLNVSKEINKKFNKEKKNKSILDLGSNDGTFLNHFKKLGWKILGVESSKNIAKMANKKKIKTLNMFFNLKNAKKIKTKFDFINASGVFFHLEELHSFTRGVKYLIKENGIFIVQFLYMKKIVENTAFDQIYHEHLLYYNLKTLEFLLNKHGLEIFDAHLAKVHGGQMVAYVCKKGIRKKTKRLNNLYDLEKKSGCNNIKYYENFSKKIKLLKKENLAFLKKCKKNNKIVYGMGAPVKGNTLLNYFKIDTKLIPILLEKNNLRDGLYSPGTHIPIKMEDNIKKLPDIYYVLAWNFKREILKKNKNLIKKGIKFYFPIKVND